MAEPFLGEIRIVGFNFAPIGWAECNGAILSIAQNDALFSLLGTMYGGDGQTTFGIPDFRGRLAVGQGQGNGLTPRTQGEQGGVETQSLTVQQMPAHNHAFNVSSNTATTSDPRNGLYARPNVNPRMANLYTSTANTQMSPNAISPAGSGAGHENRQPSLCLLYIIALQGIYPPRS